jgi:hypothetical protein
MKHKILIIGLLSFCTVVSAQKDNLYIGVNVLQLPTTTLNVNFTTDIVPFITLVADVGYTFNYDRTSVDYIGSLLTPHCDCNNDGYEIEKQSGEYFKTGSYFNLRRSFDKRFFFRAGAFLNHSIVSEKGIYTPEGQSTVFPSHKQYVPGLSFSGGFEFALSKRFKSDIDFQMSLPAQTSLDQLYGYRIFIPGMGFKDSYGRWFPMLIWNIKYRL